MIDCTLVIELVSNVNTKNLAIQLNCVLCMVIQISELLTPCHHYYTCEPPGILSLYHFEILSNLISAWDKVGQVTL